MPDISTSWYQYHFYFDCILVAEDVGGHVVLVPSSREHASVGSQLASLKGVLSSGYFSDEEVFHRRKSWSLEKLYVSHIVLPFDLHD